METIEEILERYGLAVEPGGVEIDVLVRDAVKREHVGNFLKLPTLKYNADKFLGTFFGRRLRFQIIDSGKFSKEIGLEKEFVSSSEKQILDFLYDLFKETTNKATPAKSKTSEFA